VLHQILTGADLGPATRDAGEQEKGRGPAEHVPGAFLHAVNLATGATVQDQGDPSRRRNILQIARLRTDETTTQASAGLAFSLSTNTDWTFPVATYFTHTG